MANIFLSYDREDERRARPLAELLERTGHSVWWDRQIKGGGEFGAEIEAALESAEKVVVLWSKQAVRSAWVRDEAATGRDTGRLVPTTIDGTPAPLGFRQYQTIDLSRWKGRGTSPQIAELLDALGTASAARETAHAAPPRQKLPLSGRALTVAASVLALALGGVMVWQFVFQRAERTPTFAIVSADRSQASNNLASAVVTRISGLDDPAAADFHIVDADAAPTGRGYRLKLASGSTGRAGSMSLVAAQSGAIIWSVPIDARGAPDNVAQATAVSAQRALSCAADALSQTRDTIDQDTLKLYVTGCTEHDAAYGTNSSNAALIKTFEQVTTRAPHFASAWSKLLELETEQMTQPDDPAAEQRKAKVYLALAEKLGIDVPEAYGIKAHLHSPDDFLGILRTFDEGIRKHPESAILHRWRGEALTYVGRMNNAIADTGQAVQLDPLSPANQQTFANVLANGGNIDAGYAQLRKAEQIWPDSFTVGMARYRMDLRYGDPKEALVLSRTYTISTSQNPAQEKVIQARINPTPANIDAAIEAERKINRQFPPFIASLIQTLAYFGRKDEAIDLLVNYPGKEWIGYNAEVLFRPMMRDVWRDPRSIAGAAHVGLLRYWKTSGNWPDFCFDPTLPYDCKKEAAKYRV
jgi:tetratricopeptide (TPR) repeat protein